MTFDSTNWVCRCPRTCPNGASQLSNCQCQCPSGYTFNTATWQCDLDCPRACPTGATQLASCSCQCPQGQIFNSQTWTCDVQCPLACPAGALPLPGCSCQCPQGQIFNSQSWTCECPRSCPFGATQTSSCSCQCPQGQTFNSQRWTCDCPRSCPAGASQTSSCSCQCPQGQTFNSQTWTCGCPRSCPSGATQTSTCSCQCPQGQTFNPQTWTCGCQRSCPNGATQLSSCSCQCPQGQTFNSLTWTCGCQRSCPTGATQLSSCSCQCPQGQIFNSLTWTCGCQRSCPSGATQLSSCSCQCPQGQTFNSLTWTCGCQRSCPTGATQTSSCSCQCPQGQIFNSQTWTCGCQRSCPAGATQLSCSSCQCPQGQTFNSLTWTCELKCPKLCPNLSVQLNDCSCQCPTGQTFNTATWSCDAVTCPSTCPSNAIQQTDCSCLCPQGYWFDTFTRLCVYDNRTLEVCPDSEFHCENSQLAYRDCNGQCFCSCAQGYAGSRCEILVTADLCDDCIYSNGHYQAGVSGYCNLYVICVPVGPTNAVGRPVNFTPYIMNCPSGTAYITRSDGWRGCDYLSNGVCAQDQCLTLPARSTYADTTSCQRYWQCGANQQILSLECCPSGQAYSSQAGGCVTDSSCPVTCGPNVPPSCDRNINGTVDACPFAVNPLNPNEFFYKTVVNAKQYCQAGMIMDLTLCACVDGPDQRPLACEPTVDMDFEGDFTLNDEDRVPRVYVNGIGQVANFRGTDSDNIVLKAFAGSGFYTDYFQINLRLFLKQPITGNQRVAIVTNADCDVEESVSITADGTNFYFKIFQLGSNQQPVEIVIPYAGLADANGWYDLKLVYKLLSAGNYEFSGTVGGDTVIYNGPILLNRVIDRRTCALHLGYGFNYAGLDGYVDNFQVWRCDPNSIVVP